MHKLCKHRLLCDTHWLDCNNVSDIHLLNAVKPLLWHGCCQAKAVEVASQCIDSGVCGTAADKQTDEATYNKNGFQPLEGLGAAAADRGIHT